MKETKNTGVDVKPVRVYTYKLYRKASCGGVNILYQTGVFKLSFMHKFTVFTPPLHTHTCAVANSIFKLHETSSYARCTERYTLQILLNLVCETPSRLMFV